ncbi:MAG: GNAT family N-acetyltransferase [Brevundimonas sp.]|nr:GNAT family N-acetyltransferase [Brevundimonas sp.]
MIDTARESCRVRRAGRDDIEVLERLLEETWPQFGSVWGRPWGDFFKDEQAAAFVGNIRDEPCGCVLIAMDEPVIHALCVAEIHRGNAYADDLLNAAIQWARTEHANVPILTLVEPDNEKQKTRFERMGFVVANLAWTRTDHLLYELPSAMRDIDWQGR